MPTISLLNIFKSLFTFSFKSIENRDFHEYTTPHGHVYRTDHKGRIKEVYADDLSLLDGGRNSYAQRTVGREDRLPDDDGGHLIARGFGGSKDIDNLVPQSKYINRSFKENGEWYNMKKEWQKAIKKGEK